MKIPSGPALALLAILLPAENVRAAVMTFDTAPEITFDVPKGWAACDAATSAELQGPPPAGKLKVLCGRFDSTGGARMVGSPDSALVMSFAAVGPADFPPAFFRTVTPEQISSLSSTLCQSMFQIAAGTVPCTFALQAVAGRPAFVGRVRPPNSQFEAGHVVIVSGESRSVILIFLVSAPSSDTDDRINAIVASIRFSEKSEQH